MCSMYDCFSPCVHDTLVPRRECLTQGSHSCLGKSARGVACDRESRTTGVIRVHDHRQYSPYCIIYAMTTVYGTQTKEKKRGRPGKRLHVSPSSSAQDKACLLSHVPDAAFGLYLTEIFLNSKMACTKRYIEVIR